MPEATSLANFLSDEGRKYIRVGDLQLLKEHLQRVRSSGMQDRELRSVEEAVSRIENTVALLLEIIEQRLPAPD